MTGGPGIQRSDSEEREEGQREREKVSEAGGLCNQENEEGGGEGGGRGGGVGRGEGERGGRRRRRRGREGKVKLLQKAEARESQQGLNQLL